METIGFVQWAFAFGGGIAAGFGVRGLFRLPHAPQRTKHQAEYQEALDEIVRLDAENSTLSASCERLRKRYAESLEDCIELSESVDHLTERLKTSEEIRQKLAASLFGRCCGGQITMGNTDAKVVHGSVVVGDPDADSRRNV